MRCILRCWCPAKGMQRPNDRRVLAWQPSITDREFSVDEDKTDTLLSPSVPIPTLLFSLSRALNG